MSPRQRVVLGALSPSTDLWYRYMTSVAEDIGMTPRVARNAARALSRMGYARLERLFDECTGLTAGSTYVRTIEGSRALRQTEEATGD